MCMKNVIVVHGLSLWDIIPYSTQCWESWTLEIQHGSSTWWFGKGVSFRTPYSNGAHFNIQSLVCNYKNQETSGFSSYKLHHRWTTHIHTQLRTKRSSSTNKNSHGTRQTNQNRWNKSAGTPSPVLKVCPLSVFMTSRFSAFSRWGWKGDDAVGVGIEMWIWMILNDIDNHWILLIWIDENDMYMENCMFFFV